MMKKALLAGSALALLGAATAAQASSPIKLELGGSALWVFGVSTQDKEFKRGMDYSSTDVKGNNFVFFDGETTLDNGMKVGFHSSLRAGGNSNSGHNPDPIDQSWVYAEGRLGKVLIGTNDNPAYLLHVSAPDAAGLSEDAGLGILSGRWVGAPDGLYYLQTTAIDTTGSADRIMYFTPKMAGFTVGVGFTPGTSNDENDYTQGNRNLGTANETYTAGVHYEYEFSKDANLEASLGWQGGQGLHTTDAFGNWSGNNINTYNDFSGGMKVSVDSFTFGGGARYQRTTTDSYDDRRVKTFAWTVGAQYDFDKKVVPMSVSLNYFNSRAKFERIDARDRVHNVNLSGNYELGTGVNWVSTLGYIKFNGDSDKQTSDNDGIAAITGLSLSF